VFALAVVSAAGSLSQAETLPKPLPAADGAAAAGMPDTIWMLRDGGRVDLTWADDVLDAGAYQMDQPSAEPVIPPSGEATIYVPAEAHPQSEPWRWQMLPSGLIYRSYLAGAKEPRFASAWVNERNLGWIWDIALGGRVGIVRYGTQDPRWPEGWQLDIEGAGLPRLYQDGGWQLMAADFRFGIPLTYGRGRHRTKVGYYHLSSHLGDEYMLLNPGAERINYSRDVLIWGNSYYWTRNLRLYAEAGWAFNADDGAEPWEFQFGIDYSPDRPSMPHGSPFFAINAHLREEVAFGGNVVVQTGWQWRGMTSGQLFRMGMQYFAGMSEQFEFYDQYEY
jgi:outer membrane protein assembly factor BamB